MGEGGTNSGSVENLQLSTLVVISADYCTSKYYFSGTFKFQGKSALKRLACTSSPNTITAILMSVELLCLLFFFFNPELHLNLLEAIWSRQSCRTGLFKSKSGTEPSCYRPDSRAMGEGGINSGSLTNLQLSMLRGGKSALKRLVARNCTCRRRGTLRIVR